MTFESFFIFYDHMTFEFRHQRFEDLYGSWLNVMRVDLINSISKNFYCWIGVLGLNHVYVKKESHKSLMMESFVKRRRRSNK